MNAWTTVASGKKDLDFDLLKEIVVDNVGGDKASARANVKKLRDLLNDDEFLMETNVMQGEATDPSDDKAAAAAARERETNEMIDDILGCRTATDFYTVCMKHSSTPTGGDTMLRLLRREIIGSSPLKTCKFDEGPVGVGERWGPCVARERNLQLQSSNVQRRVPCYVETSGGGGAKHHNLRHQTTDCKNHVYAFPLS